MTPRTHCLRQEVDFKSRDISVHCVFMLCVLLSITFSHLLSLIFNNIRHLQCHGLWDEDDPKEKKEPPPAARQSESEEEGKGRDESDKESASASSVMGERRGSIQTLRSINFGTSIDSGNVQVHCAQQQTYQRRKSSSGGSHISHRSLHSSARSKRGEGPLDPFVQLRSSKLFAS